MASFTKIKFNVPALNRSFKSGAYRFADSSTIAANKKTISEIDSNLGDYITKWGNEFGIPKEIIISFIATESTGKNAPPNKYQATGYMQATPKTVYETITKWTTITGNPLSDTAKSFLAKKIPSYTKWSANITPSSTTLNEIKQLLRDPEFNIMMGTAIIRWIFEAYNYDSGDTFAKTMASYNSGYYATKSKVKGNLTAEQIYKKGFNAETKGYLVKMLGKNGFLELQLKK